VANEKEYSYSTDLALIKKDISQIERFLTKLDPLMQEIALISKTLAIQEKIVETHEKRLDGIDEKLSKHYREEEEFRKYLQKKLDSLSEDNKKHADEVRTTNSTEREKRHKEVLGSINELRNELKTKNKEQDERLDRLEQWKWWVMGAAAAIIGAITLFFG
jgi:DNA repair exonuclease SbcCD ATPase subunit